MNQSIQNQQTRDELRQEPETHEIYKVKSDNVIVVEGPLRTEEDYIGESWIVGSSTNGIVGTNTGTQSGAQQVVGGSGRVQVLKRVLNPNNIFNEVFAFTTFKDTSNTTANWDTTNQNLVFTGSQTATSSQIYLDATTITQAKINVTSTTAVTSQLSTDGSTWQTVSNNTQTNLTSSGTALYFRIISSESTTATRVNVQYS